jgi:hypothetical protein
MQDQPTRRVVATVLGLDVDPDYLLAEDADGQQLVVRRDSFEGDWSSLKRGELVELVATCARLSRVLSARRVPGLDA